jgi:iron complex transport system ATP-binding protein
VSHSDAALVLQSPHPWHILSSAVVGGGFLHARVILNWHVRKGYDHPRPAADLIEFAHRCKLPTPFVGMMTAALLQHARAATYRAEGMTATAVVTAGLSNASTPGVSPPAILTPGTINMIVLLDVALLPAAMVNAVITATEVKTQVVLAQGACTPEGHPATGTSTDAVVIACTGRGPALPYAGAATPVGWLIGCSVRTALTEALQASGYGKGTYGRSCGHGPGHQFLGREESVGDRLMPLFCPARAASGTVQSSKYVE